MSVGGVAGGRPTPGRAPPADAVGQGVTGPLLLNPPLGLDFQSS
jgi:hypothetical protein